MSEPTQMEGALPQGTRLGPLSVESPRNAQDENELQSVFNEPLLKDAEINRLNEGDPEQMREIFQTMKRRQKDRIQHKLRRD